MIKCRNLIVLAIFFSQLSSAESDISEKMDYLLGSAKAGNSWSAIELAEVYMSGYEVYTDFVKASKYLKLAADNGNMFAIKKMIDIAHDFNICDDYDYVLKVSKENINFLDKQSINKLAMMNLYGSCGAVSYGDAIDLYEELIARGDVSIKIFVASLYASKKNEDVNLNKATKILSESIVELENLKYDAENIRDLIERGAH